MMNIRAEFESWARRMGCDSHCQETMDEWEDLGRDEIFAAGYQAATEAARGGEVVAWRVIGSYTDCAMKDKSSAKAYCKGLLEGDPKGGYSIEPLYTQPPAPVPPCRFHDYSHEDCETYSGQVPCEPEPPSIVVPKGWLVVPPSPTPEMIEAALEAHMPFGDMQLAITMANFAAPESAR